MRHAGLRVEIAESHHHTQIEETNMGPLGMQEMLLIFVVILLLFGAKKIPEFARGMGKAMGEFKKAREEFEHEIQHAAKQSEQEVLTKKEAPAEQAVSAIREPAGKENHGA